MVLQFEEDITGYAVMTINRQYIDKICSQSLNQENMQIIITDEEGTILSHPDESKVLSRMDGSIMEGISEMEEDGNKERFFKTRIDGEELLVSYDVLSRNKWRVISIIPYSYLMQSTTANMNIAFAAVTVLIAFSIWVASYVTKSISSPVKHLITAMDEAGWGNLKVRMDENWTDSRDEHAQLARGFNDMTARLQTLIDEVYRSEIKKKELEFRKKEAELNALQQQINPHFLYNTLETIYWMAMAKGENEIGEMVTALGNFFRKSINKGIEYVTVAEEVKNVQYYVYLQKIRFRDRFNVVWDIAEDVVGCRIIKLVLQPIIENAIIHGVESLEHGGLIIVKGYVKDCRLYFEVIDNGKGMPEQMLREFEEHINNGDADTGKSVGIKNVHQRIRLYYGEKYGIHITSRENKGTRVVLELPVISGEEPYPAPGREAADV
jgi:two-component system sensor histidine kinase YesM